MTSRLRALLSASVAVVLAAGFAQPSRAEPYASMRLPGGSGFMEVAGRAAGPAAFGAFCARYPVDCARSGPALARMPLTPERLAELQAVNAQVNRAVAEVSDLHHHGREDVWSLAENGRGDCEDFALAKRRLLIERGWPSSVLLMTVVATASGEGHAVLTAVTDRGDFVLDNRTSPVKLWSETGHLFFTRQSQGNPRAWVSVAGSPLLQVASGRRPQRGPAQ
jgi:predicted transglutaminase-like cysteine proteinase